jgi:O-antigen/teichoic acid export membrane protein
LRQAGWLGERKVESDVSRFTLHASRFTFHVSRLTLYWQLLRQALPLGIAIFLSIAYTRLAVLMLQARLGEVAVARFSAAFRLIEPAQILPASLLAAAFPAFSYALRHNPPQARRLGIRVSLLLALLGGSVTAAFWLAAPWLIPLLYGEAFVNSIAILQILGLSTLPAFINYSLTHYLIARGQQAIMGLFTATMLTLHAALSWYLIPSAGAAGPAVSIILAESMLLLCCLLTLAVTKPKAIANQ